MPALRDPANETPPAESPGHAVTGPGDQLQAEARHLGAIHAALARRVGG